MSTASPESLDCHLQRRLSLPGEKCGETGSGGRSHPSSQTLAVPSRLLRKPRSLAGLSLCSHNRGREMDEKISSLFQDWLSAFDAVQVASGEEAITRAHSRLSEIETQIANTSGEGMECLVIKLGLHCFLSEH